MGAGGASADARHRTGRGRSSARRPPATSCGGDSRARCSSPRGLQIGVNYANDYFDGVRGVDTAERIGPPRLTASGRVSPRAVLLAALAALFVGALAGLALALATAPIAILFVGALALVAALLYSGGPRPYAGLGLGEVMVFCFFGLMAVVRKRLRAGRDDPRKRLVVGCRDGIARRRRARREQPARHLDGCGERQANARGSPRRPADAPAVPSDDGGRVRRDRCGRAGVHRERVGRDSRNGGCSPLPRGRSRSGRSRRPAPRPART